MDTEIEGFAAAVDEDGGTDYLTAGGLDDVDGFLDAESGGENVIYDEGFCSGGDGRTASEGFDSSFAFDVDATHAEESGDFKGDDDAAGGGASDEFDALVLVMVGDGLAEGAEDVGLFEDAELLEVDGAVASAGEDEMTGEDGSAGLEERLEVGGVSHEW